MPGSTRGRGPSTARARSGSTNGVARPNGRATAPAAAGPLVDSARGLVNRRIFSDEAIYQRELEQVFARCWLFLAHETMLPNSGDYLTTYMGEDSVVVVRGKDGRIRAFLNSCRHRGNRVCLLDSGNASVFTCTYHGWAYTTEGRLTGVPFFREAYYEELDKDALSLPEVRTETYAGFVFGCGDPDGPSFAESLGNLKWYFDRLLSAEWNGGLEVAIPVQKYMAAGNWKIIAENFAGDHYHTNVTHGAFFKLGLVADTSGYETHQDPGGPFEVALDYGHGIGGIFVGDGPFERELRQAEKLGPDVAAYARERYERLKAVLADSPSKPYNATHGTLFPNFCWSGKGNATGGRTFYTLHPRGPLHTEVNLWYAVERNTPPAVREKFTGDAGRGGQLPSGFFAQDDAENFERVTEATRGVLARRYPLNYTMQLRHEGSWPGQEEWDIRGLPGVVGPRFAEHIQRNFYRYWAELLDAPSSEAERR